MSVARIASRYAKTLVDLSIQQKKLDRVLEDVESFKTITDESRDFQNFLKTPIIHKDKKQSIIKKLFEKSYDDLTMKFLLLLIAKQREMYLPEIANEFILQYKNLKHITTVKVTSAVELSKEALDKIEQKLKKGHLAGEKVEFETVVDPELIGGVIIEFNDEVYDASVSHRLNKYKKNFGENLYVSLIQSR
jgi:F-type H+-transporting ATPase subunit delta